MGHNLPRVNWALTPFDVAFLKGMRITPEGPRVDAEKQARWENYMAKYRRSAAWWEKHKGRGEDGSHYSA